MVGFCRGNLDMICPVSLPKYARVAKLMNKPVSTTPEQLQRQVSIYLFIYCTKYIATHSNNTAGQLG